MGNGKPLVELRSRMQLQLLHMDWAVSNDALARQNFVILDASFLVTICWNAMQLYVAYAAARGVCCRSKAGMVSQTSSAYAHLGR